MSDATDIREAWKHRVVIGDGAMATMLHQSGVPIRTCYEELCLTHPQLVRDVHKAYIAAGAEVIQTNTFGAHRIGLARYGLEAKVAEVNRASVAVAREAAKTAERQVWVFGTIGSTADLGYKQAAEDTPYTLREVFAEQLEPLLSAGVDGIILETFAYLDEMLVALGIVREMTDLPVLATLSPDTSEVTRDGVPIVEAFAQIERAGADVVGLNCRLGLAGILRSYERLALSVQASDGGRRTDTVFAAVPNAGMMNITDGDVTYTAGAEYFADMGLRLARRGVHFIGGCCGTTPHHIERLHAKIHEAGGLSTPAKGTAAVPPDDLTPGSDLRTETDLLRGIELTSKSGRQPQSGPALHRDPAPQSGQTSQSGQTKAAGTSTASAPGPAGRTPSTAVPPGRTPPSGTPAMDVTTAEAHRNHLRIVDMETRGDGEVRRPSLVERVRQQTTVIVELDPPRTTDLSRYMEGARALHLAGADSITLADNSLGTVRVSNMAVASMLKTIGINPLVHVTCRDRNLIGQQSHLMGLHVLGIHDILLVTGDPSRFGDLPGATSVYDVSSIDLTRMVRKLNEGIAFSGQPMKQPAHFSVGTSFNPHVRNFDKAIERLVRKVDAGADYVMTQPVYHERTMEAMAKATAALGVPVFVGVMPLVSARNALFLHNEVPGMQIPEDILTRMTDAVPELATQVGLDIAESLTTTAREYFNGIYLMTPFLRYDLTARLTQVAKAGSVELGASGPGRE